MQAPNRDVEYLEHLQARYENGERPKYVFFWGRRGSQGRVDASCFSQWFESPFVVDGERFATAEHYMMAEKARLFGDEANRTRILAAASPGGAKAYGRKVLGFDQARWKAERFSIVVRGNIAKFSQHSELGQFLLQTKPRVLVEASPVDRIWGIGLTHDDDRASNPILWRGLNLLGFALMQVRDHIGAR
ncbi:MAG: NADAR family protein [Gammaproteobacteria bacterium]|nr:NADAR family protein [Gammaproteobacteria bacterium]MCP5458682.1 NADAR family protein [Gammaproteobacteria bacterium]